MCMLAGAPLPPRVAADVDDAYAVDVNPAALAVLPGSELRLLYGQRRLPGEHLHGGGAAAALKLGAGATIGAAYDFDHRAQQADPYRLRLGMGLGGRAFSLGAAWRRARPLTGRAHDAWALGVLVRPRSWLSLAAGVDDLAEQGAVRAYKFSAATRLFGDRWTGGVELSLPDDGGGIRREAWTFRTRATPWDGVEVGVSLRPGAFVGLEAGLSLERLASGFWLQAGEGARGRQGQGSFVTDLQVLGARRPSVFATRRVMLVELDGDLRPDPKFRLLSQRFEYGPYGAVPATLVAAARAPRLAGVWVRIGKLDIGWAKAEGIRSALKLLRAQGKRVDCALDAASDIEYFVATACDGIFLSPPQTLAVDGLAANTIFFGAGLQRIGVKAEAVRREEYKTAVDSFTRSSMSAPHRAMLGAYLDDVYGAVAGAVVEGRGLTRAQVEQAISRGTRTASEALAARWVDEVLYPDEVEGHLRSKYGRVRWVTASDGVPARPPAWGAPPQIAVLHIDAPIASGESRDLPFGLGQTAGARTIIRALERVRSDGRIKALVLRVDSPGGDSVASDLIARAVQRVRERKPVIASFGDVAASGGYYVAAGADHIYASPSTLTGSIGVYVMKFSFHGLLDRLGIHVASIVRGKVANRASPYHDLSEAERASIDRQVDAAYQDFLRVVAKGRGMSIEAVRAVAGGRIYSGKAARAKGLVDALGGLHDAIQHAKRLTKLTDASVALVQLPENRSKWPDFLAVELAAETDSAWTQALPRATRAALRAALSVPAGGVSAHLPFALELR